MKLLLLEGIPGSGKSTTANLIATLSTQTGKPAYWHLEEAADHPIHSAALKQLRYHKTFADACLEKWQDLTRDITSSNEICILEGSAFQNTIRFMIEGLNQDIDAYFEHFQHAIQALEPRFIYLRPADLDQALAYTCHSRGNEWASKVAGYLETTPFCQSNELKGLPGMFSFWKSYALQCDTLFNQLRMPKLTVSPQAGRWEEQIPVICNFLGIPYPLKAENKACA